MMAVFEILPRTNLKYSDIRDTLNAGGGTVNNNVSSAFKETAKINRYSFCKPVDNPSSTGIKFTKKTYTDSTKIRTYKIGDITPSTSEVNYILPKGGKESPYRLGDFREYNANEYPLTVDFVDIPSIVPDGFSKNYSTTYTNTRLFLYLIYPHTSDDSHPWYNAVLYKFTKQGVEPIYIRSTAQNGYEFKLTFGIPYNIYDIYKLFREKNISTYDCKAMAIAIPYNHRDNTNFTKVLPNNCGYLYPLIPSFKGSKTIVEAKFAKPFKRCFFNLRLLDKTHNTDEFLPDHLVYIRYTVKDDLGNIYELDASSLLEAYARTAQDYNISTGSVKTEGTKITKIITELEVSSITVTNGANITQVVNPQLMGGNYNSYEHTPNGGYLLKWEKDASADFCDMFVGITYIDPNYRPDEL